MLAVADAELFADRHRGFLMVAGNHFDLNACILALADSIHHLITRRIDDARESQKYKPFLQIVMIYLIRGRPFRQLLHRKSNDPLSFAGMGLHLVTPEAGIERGYVIILCLTVRHFKQAIRSTLDVDKRSALILRQHRHIFILGVEWQLRCYFQFRYLGLCLARKRKQTAFRRITLKRPFTFFFGQNRIVAGYPAYQQMLQRPILFRVGLLLFVPANFAIRSVARSCYLVFSGGCYHGGDRHFVFGQGACFVRADDRNSAECFYRRQIADNCFSFRHILYTDCQDNGQNGR
ncbi:hypothetical protein D3C75_561490 [compost metagenome]